MAAGSLLERTAALKDIFKSRLKSQMKTQRAALRTDSGKVAAAINILTGLPSAIQKVRSAPKKHRVWVGVREAGRMYGRITLGPLWSLGEKLFGRRRRRKKS